MMTGTLNLGNTSAVPPASAQLTLIDAQAQASERVMATVERPLRQLEQMPALPLTHQWSRGADAAAKDGSPPAAAGSAGDSDAALGGLQPTTPAVDERAAASPPMVNQCGAASAPTHRQQGAAARVASARAPAALGIPHQQQEAATSQAQRCTGDAAPATAHLTDAAAPSDRVQPAAPAGGMSGLAAAALPQRQAAAPDAIGVAAVWELPGGVKAASAEFASAQAVQPPGSNAAAAQHNTPVAEARRQVWPPPLAAQPPTAGAQHEPAGAAQQRQWQQQRQQRPASQQPARQHPRLQLLPLRRQAPLQQQPNGGRGLVEALRQGASQAVELNPQGLYSQAAVSPAHTQPSPAEAAAAFSLLPAPAWAQGISSAAAAPAAAPWHGTSAAAASGQGWSATAPGASAAGASRRRTAAAPSAAELVAMAQLVSPAALAAAAAARAAAMHVVTAAAPASNLSALYRQAAGTAAAADSAGVRTHKRCSACHRTKRTTSFQLAGAPAGCQTSVCGDCSCAAHGPPASNMHAAWSVCNIGNRTMDHTNAYDASTALVQLHERTCCIRILCGTGYLQHARSWFAT